MTSRQPERVPEPVEATGFCDPDVSVEGDPLHVHAELSDVDEVAVVVKTVEGDELVAVHLDRVHAIALAGQLATAATQPPTVLPHGHNAENWT